MINKIAFPGLSLGPFEICESFKVFGLTIHWYGVIIALGIVLAYLLCCHIAKDYDVNSDTLIDILIYGLPSAIICARIYYVAFRWEEYSNNLLDIFKIWNGGIAVYGSIIGALISTFIYCRLKKIKFTKTLDIGCFGLLTGQIIGRWGNFVNAEAYGSETTSFLRMELLDLGISVHPTFLYESLWNLCVLALLYFFFKKKQTFQGELFLLYITGYGLGRLWIEGLRTDSLFLGPVRISQIVALLCVIIGIGLFIYFKIKNKKQVI